MQLPFLLALASAAVAALIGGAALWRAKWSSSSCLFALGMFTCSIISIIEGMAQASVAVGDAERYYVWSMLPRAVSPAIWLLFSLIYGRANSREFLAKWKWLWIGAFVLPAALALVRRDDFVSLLVDPMSGRFLMRLTLEGIVFKWFLLLTSLLALMNLEHTFRASVGTTRWRIKYMIVGLAVLLGVRAYTSSQALLYRAIDPFLTTVNNLGLALGCLLTLRSLLRPGHWEAETYPTKAVFLNSVTILAAGAYLTIVGVLAKVAVWLGGDTSFEVKAFLVLVSVALVAVLALSDRVRLHLRRWMSHYLQQPAHDYRAVWRSFTEGMSTQVDEENLSQVVIKLTAKIFELLSVSIWLVDEKQENLKCVASTLLSSDQETELQPTPQETQAVLRYFHEHYEPLAIEKSADAWAQTLRKCHPTQFRTGGDRVCAPLIASGKVLGVMLLGDRVGGVRFSIQDFDLLRCVGDQTAAALLNARLSKRLLQNKEMEAFQTMSTFFVHDLKNLASTLNLMLKNLPIHFDNPDFRADALRGVGKTCDHINHLISRLSMLRESMQLSAVETDLNKVVAQALRNCPPADGVALTQELPPLPSIMIDAEQIDKVITNLALNAIEAVPPGGRIHVRTAQQNGWAVVTVADTGCGMDTEFVRRSLFRPFQTTKKKGLGIGMFQSKMIVEAHGGRIEVETARGKGSTFRVLLPLPKATA